MVDFGDDAVMIACDFSPILSLSGLPICNVLARSKAVRLLKVAFESMWFSLFLN